MAFKFSRFFFLLLLVLSIPLRTQSVLAVEVGVGFDPSIDGRVVGYKLYYGTNQNSFDHVDLGPATEYIFPNLTQGTTYYFAATAYDGNRNESELSEVLVYKVPVSSGGETSRLLLDMNVASFTVEAGGKTYSQARVSTGDGTAAKFSVGDDAAWLAVSPSTGTTPQTLTVSVDATNLSAGTYFATITANAAGYAGTGKQVKLAVTEKTTPGPGTHALLVSPFPNRSSASSLAGWSGTGDIYVFVSPETGISRVSFYIDDPSMSKKPYRVEGIAPYDLAGGTSYAAKPFDASALSSGWHEITAFIELTGGGLERTSAVFSTVPDTYQQDPNTNGMVSIEAENFDLSTSKIGHQWSLVNDSRCSSSKALEATPNTGSNMNTAYVEYSPRLDYTVNFAQSGLHYVWVRGLAPSVNDDSVHVGLNGQASLSSERMAGFDKYWNWSNRTMDGAVAFVDVAKAGLHTVNVWMREDGFLFDKLLLTKNPGYIPTGLGPAESVRSDGTGPGGSDMHELLASTWSNRSKAVPLEGQNVSGLVYVFVGPETDIYRVSFYIDDPSMRKAPHRVEAIAPYDLKGGSTSFANPLDTSLLSRGPHEITALVELGGGGHVVLSSIFSVNP